MSKIIDAQDILGDAKLCIECMFMAMNELDIEHADPLQSVANVVSKRIDEALALLDEYRTDIDAGPVEYPAPPAAEPKTANEEERQVTTKPKTRKESATRWSRRKDNKK